MEYCTSQQLHAMDKVIGNIKTTGSHINNDPNSLPAYVRATLDKNEMQGYINTDSCQDLLSDLSRMIYEVHTKIIDLENESAINAFREFACDYVNKYPKAMQYFIALDRNDALEVLLLGLKEFEKTHGRMPNSERIEGGWCCDRL